MGCSQLDEQRPGSHKEARTQELVQYVDVWHMVIVFSLSRFCYVQIMTQEKFKHWC